MAMIPILIRFLQAKAASFYLAGRMLTIGHQEVILTPKQFEQLFSMPHPEPHVSQETLFRALGAEQVESLDYFGTEEANINCDLNIPFENKTYYAAYDTILDGGTLEHVFNTGICLKNLINLLKVDGTIIHINPCQGYFNHGFYSFQPTMYFDLYNSNGFVDCECYLIEFIDQDRYSFFGQARIYQVENTSNGNFSTSNDTLIVFKARKKEEAQKIIIPFQSIYRQSFESQRAP
jgi:hypothetical protein